MSHQRNRDPIRSLQVLIVLEAQKLEVELLGRQKYLLCLVGREVMVFRQIYRHSEQLAELEVWVDLRGIAFAAIPNAPA